MKKYLVLSMLLVLVLGTSCNSNKKSMDSPRATFETLKNAILDRDIETYTACWHPGRVEKEGMVSKLKSNPDEWDELTGYFKGEVSVSKVDFFERDGNKMCKIQIEAPDADGGGLGGAVMIKVDDTWLMWGW